MSEILPGAQRCLTCRNWITPEGSCPKCSAVYSPAHYTTGGIECIDAIKAALTAEEFRGFCKGNVLKYVWREQGKGQDQDLAKARWYLDRLVSQ